MTPKQAFWKGARDCAPFILIIMPYSMLFGVVARDAGLNLTEAMAMSVLVIAGASQFTALALLQEHAPVFIALLAALAVNMRMALYSAALVPHVGHAPIGTRALMAYLMVDQVFATAVKTYETEPSMTPPAKLALYFGCVSVAAPFWYVFTFLGAWLGTSVPASLSLDFAMPVCFIALTAPLIRSLPHSVAALTAGFSALLFAGMPWSLGLICAAFCGMIAGAQTELYVSRRRAGVKP